MAPKINKKIKLPLIDEINNTFQPSFLPGLADERSGWVVPSYITDNLKHELRNYQGAALNGLNYTQRDPNVSTRFNQILFHMATGSGKTDLMAATILYMFTEFNYQNFLFVVNTNAVVSKTRENLINSSSSKYLFTNNIIINGQNISINEVKTFNKNPEVGTINIRLATAQTLMSELGSPRENGLTYEDLKDFKLVILADEAHHYMADTKANSKNVKGSASETKSWENMLARIRQANANNRQLGFTATIDFTDSLINAEYAGKIAYQYDLSAFQGGGYSKNIHTLKSNIDDESKMLNAVLLSQYRKSIAFENNIKNFKPVILFKSNKIDISNSMRDKFVELIENLTVEKLRELINSNTDSNALSAAYAFFKKRSLGELVVELQRDFSRLNIINVNDTTKEGILGDTNDFSNLNTLENVDNPFRVIFAVAKLSEGWDVLNLFDIVRVGEGYKSNSNETNAEAQLIGRGARYYPFEYEGKTLFTRRFDYSGNSDLQILEMLHYHTINDSSYVSNLKKSFEEMNMQVEDDSDFDKYDAKVKPSFMKSDAFKTGKIYYNETEEIPDKEWDSFSKYGINIAEFPQVNLNNSVVEAQAVDDGINDRQESDYITIDFEEDSLNLIWKKAIAKNPFFEFSNLKKYIPTLKSMRDFQNSKNWLGQIVEINVETSPGVVTTRELKLKAVEQYLERIQREILMNYKKERGTNKFTSVPISEVVVDYSKKVARNLSNVIGGGQLIEPVKMDKKDWFVYDYAIVNGLEQHLIELIETFVNRLQEKYKEVYLIRNDERISNWALHQFKGETTHYAGFKPDFILWLKDAEYSYNIFIEPKGQQLLEQDQWKEDLLLSLNNQADLDIEDENVRIYGFKFYTNNNKENDTRNVRGALEGIIENN